MQKCGALLSSVLLIAAALVLGVPPTVSAGTAGLGDFNHAFGNGGRTLYNRGGLAQPTSDAGYATAVQSDGRIIVVGETTNNGGGFSSFLILRYLPTGTLDPTFGIGGVRQVAGFDLKPFSRASGVAIDSQGRILVGGTAADVQDYEHSSARFAVTRLDANGDIDSTFGNNGRATTTFAPGGGAEATGLALAANDRPLLAGYVQNYGGRTGVATARFTSAGILDGSYGTGGKTVYTYQDTHAVATSVEIDWDFRVVMSVYVVVGASTHLGVMKLLSNGTRDPAFKQEGSPTNGFRLYNGYGLSPYAQDVAIQNGGRGRVLLLSTGTVGGEPRSTVLGIDRATGELQQGFGTDGLADVAPLSLTAIAVLPNDSIVGVGDESNELVATMYSSQGRRVAGFGAGGYQELPRWTAGRAVTANSAGVIYATGSDTTIHNSVLTASLYGTAQALPAKPRFTTLARQGRNVVATWNDGGGASVDRYQYRHRRLRINGSAAAFTPWRSTNNPRLAVRTTRANPGFDLQVSGIGQFGSGPVATTRWFTRDRGPAACRVVTPNRITYQANNRAVVTYPRRTNRCAAWRLNNQGRFRPLPPRQVRTPLLRADRLNQLRIRRGGGSSLIALRSQ